MELKQIVATEPNVNLNSLKYSGSRIQITALDDANNVYTIASEKEAGKPKMIQIDDRKGLFDKVVIPLKEGEYCTSKGKNGNIENIMIFGSDEAPRVQINCIGIEGYEVINPDGTKDNKNKNIFQYFQDWLN